MVITQPRQEKRVMAEQKDDPGQAAKLAQSRKTTQSSSATDRFAAQDRAAQDRAAQDRAAQDRAAQDRAAQDRAAQDRVAGDGRTGSTDGNADKTSATVERRKQRYLIGFRSLPGIMSPPGDPFLEKLAQMDGVEIIRRLRGPNSRASAMAPTGTAQTTASSEIASPEIMVVRMDEQRGEALRQNAPPHVIVEIDAPLDYSDMVVPEPMSGRLAVQAMPFPRPRRELLFRVL